MSCAAMKPRDVLCRHGAEGCSQNTSCSQKKRPRNPSSLDLTLQTDCIGFPIPETFQGFFGYIGYKRDEIDESIEKHSCSRKILLPNLLPKLLPKLSLLPESGLSCAAVDAEESWAVLCRRGRLAAEGL